MIRSAAAQRRADQFAGNRSTGKYTICIRHDHQPEGGLKNREPRQRQQPNIDPLYSIYPSPHRARSNPSFSPAHRRARKTAGAMRNNHRHRVTRPPDRATSQLFFGRRLPGGGDGWNGFMDKRPWTGDESSTEDFSIQALRSATPGCRSCLKRPFRAAKALISRRSVLYLHSRLLGGAPRAARRRGSYGQRLPVDRGCQIIDTHGRRDVSA